MLEVAGDLRRALAKFENPGSCTSPCLLYSFMDEPLFLMSFPLAFHFLQSKCFGWSFYYINFCHAIPLILFIYDLLHVLLLTHRKTEKLKGSLSSFPFNIFPILSFINLNKDLCSYKLKFDYVFISQQQASKKGKSSVPVAKVCFKVATKGPEKGIIMLSICRSI